jgi:hypothetical protein
MSDLTPENLAFLVKIGQVIPDTKPAAASTDGAK